MPSIRSLNTIRGPSLGDLTAPSGHPVGDRSKGCRGAGSPCHGFTLLELLLSITILAVVAALVLGAFQVSHRAWEKGEAAMEASHRLRTVLERVRRQLSAAVWTPGTEVEGPDLRFSATETDMRFLSEAPLVPGLRRDRVLVHYRIVDTDDGRRLVFHEIPLVFLDPEAEAEPEEDGFLDLVTGASGIDFAYLRPGEAEAPPEWVRTWDPDEDGEFPMAVRLRIRKDAGGPAMEILARPVVPAGLLPAASGWPESES